LIGGSGGDYLFGSKHYANKLFGDDGNDLLYGNGVTDVVEGGNGNDYITDADNYPDLYNTVIYDADTLRGGGGDDTVIATGGNDSLEGNDGNDYLQSQQGNNRLDGGTGADTMFGGLGHDIYVVDSAGDVVTERAGEGTDRVLASISYTLGDNVENLGLFTSASINGTGNALANLIIGNAGANILDGRDGTDTLTGGTGTDTFAFGTALAPGNIDRITDFSVVDDTIRLDGSVFKGLADGPLAAASFAEVGAGTPSASVRILYDRSTGALFYDADGGGTASSPVQFAILDNKAALTAADFVVGLESGGGGGGTDPSGLNVVAGATDGNDSLVGTSNGDLLNGGLGADTLKGLAGNDTYVVDNAGDVVVELANEGTDTVRTSLATYTLGADVENLTFTGSAGFTGTGNAAANLITGGGGTDRLDGGAGADTMVGGLGNDTYVVDVAGDVVVEKAGEGTDRVLAGISYVLGDTIENLGLGTSASIDGTGNALANQLTGNKGNNVLDGRGGSDSLTGGLGQDTFVLRAGETVGDTVTDFVRGTDRLAFYGFGTDAVLSHGSGSDLYTVTSGDGLTSGSFRLTGVSDLDLSMGTANTDARFFA
jgi:Ca2+-binding RTX toxin-like protein